MKGRRTPYATRLKKQVTIRLGGDVIAYVKELGVQVGIPCQTLIDLDLGDCAIHQRKPSMSWN